MSNPAILWAQDRDKIYITIEVNKLDLQNLKIEGRNILVDGLEGDNNPREEFNFNLLLYSQLLHYSYHQALIFKYDRPMM